VFLWAKGLNAKYIHKEMFPVFWWWLSHKAVHSWVKRFSQGRSKVADDAIPGHPVQNTTGATVQQVDELIRAERRTTTDS
jgi:hypothetical protein